MPPIVLKVTPSTKVLKSLKSKTQQVVQVFFTIIHYEIFFTTLIDLKML